MSNGKMRGRAVLLKDKYDREGETHPPVFDWMFCGYLHERSFWSETNDYGATGSPYDPTLLASTLYVHFKLLV